MAGLRQRGGWVTDVGRVADGTLVFLMTDGFRAGVYREYEASPDGRMGTCASRVSTSIPVRSLGTRGKGHSRRGYWSEPFLGLLSSPRRRAVGADLRQRRRLAGVCNVGLIFTALSDWMNSLRLGDNGRAFIVDATGQFDCRVGRGVARRHRRRWQATAPARIGGRRSHRSETAATSVCTLKSPGHRQLGRRVFSFDDPEQGRIYARC